MNSREKQKLIAREKTNFQRENRSELMYIAEQVRRLREYQSKKDIGEIENQLSLNLYPDTQEKLF